MQVKNRTIVYFSQRCQRGDSTGDAFREYRFERAGLGGGFAANAFLLTVEICDASIGSRLTMQSRSRRRESAERPAR